MASESRLRAADRRTDWHRSAITAAPSPLARLRRALEWLMAEARPLPDEQVGLVEAHVTAVAENLNERSRGDGR